MSLNVFAGFSGEDQAIWERLGTGGVLPGTGASAKLPVGSDSSRAMLRRGSWRPRVLPGLRSLRKPFYGLVQGDALAVSEPYSVSMHVSRYFPTFFFGRRYHLGIMESRGRKNISVSVPRELAIEITEAARLLGRSRSNFLCWLISRHTEKVEIEAKASGARIRTIP